MTATSDGSQDPLLKSASFSECLHAPSLCICVPSHPVKAVVCSEGSINYESASTSWPFFMLHSNSWLSLVLLGSIEMTFVSPRNESACTLQAGHTLFTPHYMSRECSSGLESLDCKNNCIHYGRYCAMDSIGDEYKDSFKGWQASCSPPIPISCHLISEAQIQ